MKAKTVARELKMKFACAGGWRSQSVSCSEACLKKKINQKYTSEHSVHNGNEKHIEFKKEEQVQPNKNMQMKVCTHHRQEKSYLLLSSVMGGVIVSFSSKRIL